MNGNKIYQADRKFGCSHETNLLPQISKVVQTDLTKIEYRYAVFDFRSNNRDVYVELKSRRCMKDRYKNTMMSANKYKVALKKHEKGVKVFFFFNFTDGLFYWEFDPNAVVEFNHCGRTDRGREETTEYCFLPTSLLTRAE
jgi:hypothetical protein